MNKYPEIFSLTGKTIVVTGGTQRYGYYFSEAVAEAGGTAILTSRNKERADERAGELTRRGLKASGYELDLGQDASIDGFVTAVIKDHRKIDVLINNARWIPSLPGYRVTREELDKSFTVNSVGVILLTRRVIAEMKKNGGGNIINISSIYGLGGQDLSLYKEPDLNVSFDYSIQKGGLIAYTKQLATVLAKDNIRANCLTLGGFFESKLDPYFLERYEKRTPLGRMANGEDIKGPIVFLASDASAYMTGANLPVDGGWTAW